MKDKNQIIRFSRSYDISQVFVLYKCFKLIGFIKMFYLDAQLSKLVQTVRYERILYCALHTLMLPVISQNHQILFIVYYSLNPYEWENFSFGICKQVGPVPKGSALELRGNKFDSLLKFNFFSYIKFFFFAFGKIFFSLF